MSTTALEQTGNALLAAGRDIRAGWSRRTTLTVLAIAAALIAPGVLPLSGRMPDLASFVYLALAAVGLAYAVGLAGIPSLGQGAFLGVGAFAEAIARAKGGWPLLPSLLLAVVVAAAAGGLTGIATGRLRGAFVAASTWILSWIVVLGLTSFPGISGGAQGLVLPEATVFGRTLTPTAHYELGVVLLALAILAFAVIARRAPGLALAAAREQPDPALALGVPVARLRLGAFAASAAIAGLAGALGVELAQVADPSGYGPVLSFKLFVAVILGGAWTPLGPVAGLLVISAFSHAAEQVGAFRGLPGAPRGDADRLRPAARPRARRRRPAAGGPRLVGKVPRACAGRRAGAGGAVPRRGEPAAAGRARPLEALREPRRARRSRPRPQTRRGARADRAERVGQDDGAEGPRRRARARFRLDRRGRRSDRDGVPARARSPRCRRDTADDGDLSRPDGARAFARRRRPQAPPLRPLPHAPPDAEGEGGGGEGETTGARSSRAGRPAGRLRPPGRRAVGSPAAPAHAGIGPRDRAACPAAGRAGRRAPPPRSSTGS